MQTKNLVKIIKAEASILTALIDELPNDGAVQVFEVELLRNKIDALAHLAAMIDQQVTGNVDHAEPKPIRQVNPTPVEPLASAQAIPETKPKSNAIPEISVVNAKPIEQPADTQESASKKQVKEPVEKIPVIKEEPKAVENKPEVFDYINNIDETDTVEVHDEPKTEPQIQSPVTPKSEDSERPVTSSTKKTSETQGSTLGEKFQFDSPSLNDMLSDVKKKHDLASKYHHQPITDIKKSIKLNDRIRFINELFGKDSQLFEQTLSDINKAENLEEALTVIFPKFGWDQENETTVHFLELVFRRFQKQ